VEREGEEPHLPGLDMDHKQLFFLNFAQVCVTMNYIHFKTHACVHLDARARSISHFIHIQVLENK